MASGKLSPRQKMINMMYLVLTALLALNVSKEVLNSFFEVNLGIVKTRESLEKKSEETYTLLANVKDTAKSNPYIKLTNQIKPEATNLVLFIQEMKYNLVAKADKGKVYLGYYSNGEDDENEKHLKMDISFEDLEQNEKTMTIAFLNAKDDRHSSGDIFNPENKANLPNVDGEGKTTQLKNNILNYRDLLLNILEEAIDNNMVPDNGTISSLIIEINEILGIEDGEVYGEKGNKRTWEYHNFYDMPAVGALTLLSKWQADIRNLEAEVVSFLANNITSRDIKVDEVTSVVNAKSTYITSGDEYSAQIFVGASSSTMKPEIYIGDYEEVEPGIYKSLSNDPKLDLVNGRGTYIRQTGRNEVGIKTIKGFIKLPQQGEDKYMTFTESYTVAPISSAVSPDFMLAMFVGEPNPITVSAAGQDLKDVTISLSQGTKSGGKNGVWNITPSKKGPLIVTVYGVDSKKKKINLGTTKFKVYPVPGLTPELHSKINIEGTKKDDIIATVMPLTYERPPILDMFKGIQFKITKYDLIITHKNGTDDIVENVKRLQSGDGYDLVDNAKPGEILTITNIRYKKNGVEQSTGDVSFRIKIK